MGSPSVRESQLGSKRLLGGRTGRNLRRTVAAPDFPGRVRTVQVGPRDGLQNENMVIPTEDKVSKCSIVVLFAKVV